MVLRFNNLKRKRVGKLEGTKVSWEEVLTQTVNVQTECAYPFFDTGV